MSLFSFIIELAIAAFIIRFHININRISFNNLASELNRLTSSLVLPFAKFFKDNDFLTNNKIDAPALTVAGILALIDSALFFNLQFSIFKILLTTFGVLINVWLNVIFYALIISVIGSWLQTDARQPVMQIILCCSEWLLQPLRRVIPPFHGLDFSPLIAFLILRFAIVANQQLFF